MIFSNLTDYWNPSVERCGFVLKDGSFVELINTHEDTQNGFRINSADILKYEETVAATWHTHPRTSANLSLEDYKCFLAWPNWYHFIVTRDTVQGYYVEQNRVLIHDDLDLPRLSEGPVP